MMAELNLTKVRVVTNTTRGYYLEIDRNAIDTETLRQHFVKIDTHRTVVACTTRAIMLLNNRIKRVKDDVVRNCGA